MHLFRRLCIVTAILSAGVSDSFIMASSSNSDSLSTTTGTAAAAAALGAAAAQGGGPDQHGEIPLLPAADPNSDIPRLNLGETIKFETMGPIIINLDGT